jgi:hypothetical protein
VGHSIYFVKRVGKISDAHNLSLDVLAPVAFKAT